ncbi:histidine phosphatase family protein [Natronosalvus halobius]|uniref:histidine phosphatase family protein n=1 Tax=Natronosalvus halobius TaxID=2953746 RepID=UPI0020A069C8|nr:histidine phosphatase family protein [Natronosalvus halobius]USZ70574.1 histidine phosphatase family protein [Natronosalvus halobius]
MTASPTAEPTTLTFVRHAHSPYVPNREAERGLSKRGHRDAARVADVVARDGRPVDAVVSSPYARAVETVQPIAVAAGTDVVTDDGFRERALAGSHVEDFEAAIERVWSEPTFAWPGGESNDEAQVRGLEAVERTLERWPGDHVIVGTHGNLLALILRAYDDRYDFDFWQEITIPDVYQVTYRCGTPEQITRIDPGARGASN